MTTPIAQIPKPEAGQYKDNRKLFLVPLYFMSPSAPEDGRQALERYWSEVRDHVHSLERSLGQVTHVYHEAVFDEGDEGMKVLEDLNPTGRSFIEALCQSTARLEATDNKELLEESSDWQRCISVGLMSVKVMTLAVESYRKAAEGRYEHIASRIDETLGESESGVLFIRDDHHVQFPSDVRVFYVAPPALDALKRWIDGQAREATERMRRSQETAESE
jgi:hypothetical protein